MDREKFYAALRRRDSGLFGTSLSKAQVAGIEALLDACARRKCDAGQVAYILATAYGETGGRMQAVRENMNYSAAQIAKHFGAHRRQGMTPEQLARKPQLLANTVYGGEWGRKHLGNMLPDDGWMFRGWGFGQITGRRNTEKAARQIGIDLLSDPGKLDDPHTNAELLVGWMMEGHATGRRLPKFVAGAKMDFLRARAVWGGVDAQKYATNARAFLRAIEAAGGAPRAAVTPRRVQPASPTPLPRPAQAPTSPPAGKGSAAVSRGIAALIVAAGAGLAATWAEVTAWLASWWPF